MAIKVKKLRKWLDSLNGKKVAINEDGSCLVELNTNDAQTDAYLEVGGIPDTEEDEDA
jgi:hypothetical protein